MKNVNHFVSFPIREMVSQNHGNVDKKAISKDDKRISWLNRVVSQDKEVVSEVDKMVSWYNGVVSQDKEVVSEVNKMVSWYNV